ncbi:MAG: Sec-independent protein translocase subunit TatA/TatB, partial [Gammaproteobacteria bacterium]
RKQTATAAPEYMFDVGFWELAILFGLGLMVLGPERLPKVAAQLGNWAGQARRMARTLTTQMRAELDENITQPLNTDLSERRPPPPGEQDKAEAKSGDEAGGENTDPSP